jgi:hypothetical protein
MKLGFGLNVNAMAIAPGGSGSWSRFGSNWGAGAYVLLALLFIILPNVEFVVTLPSAVNPVPLGEIRLGFGF